MRATKVPARVQLGMANGSSSLKIEGNFVKKKIEKE